MTSSASAGSRLSPRTARSNTATRTSTSSTRRVMPTSAARWSACCRWSTAYCCWSMRSKGRCRRRASSPARRSRWDCSPSSWSTRSTGRARAPRGSSTRRSSCSTSSARPKAQLDFPVVYASALHGYASLDPKTPGTDMRALFETILAKVPAPVGDPDAPLQLQISALDYSSYVGRIGIGRIRRGRLKPAQEVMVLHGDRPGTRAKIGQVLGFSGLERRPVEEASAGDIVLVTGIDDAFDRDDDRRGRCARGAADDRGGRAHAVDAVPGQHLAAGRQGRQVRHQPQPARAARQGTAHQRRAARRRYRRHRRVHRVRARRTASDDTAREHAARRL